MIHRRHTTSPMAQDGETAHPSAVPVVLTLLALFFVVYGGMHAYAYVKIQTVFEPGVVPSLLVGSGLTLMMCAPVIGWYLQKHGWRATGVVVTRIAYNWMGFIFSFSWIAPVLALYQTVASTFGTAPIGNPGTFAFADRYAFIAAVALGLSAVVYGHVEARAIRVKRIRLRTPKLPPYLGRLKIVHLSDLHLGPLVGARRLRRIVARVQALKPDILVSTGDLVDREASHLDGLTNPFKEIEPRFGKFAVLGNHEFLGDLDRALDFTARAGFTLLRGEVATVADTVSVVGMDDPTGRWMGIPVHTDEKPLLSMLARERFVLLLKHQPIVKRDCVKLFDLQLSGHTHGGQIFPFGLLPKMVYRVRTGLTQLTPHSYLYVSRGAGTSGPPMRVFAPPEITLIEIEAAL